MQLQMQKISPGFNGNYCYVHARGLVLPDGFGLITVQKLDLTGCDVFDGLEMMKTADGGRTFSKPAVCGNLRRTWRPDGTSTVMCDATPVYHRKTGKILLTGHTAEYGSDNRLLPPPRPRDTVYAVYDEGMGDFGECRILEVPKTADDEYFSSGAGCTQILELPSGELLIPVYNLRYTYSDNWRATESSAVLRCSFDGRELRLLEIGDPLQADVAGGLSEPSLIQHGEEFFLTLRAAQSGYVAKSRDGLHYDSPRALCFDDGENVGNYNTQQHWLTGGGRLYLVYTRRAGTNDHVFRHRAPLFIAEFDPDRMCVLRSTEQIAVPERGARLGNFGCQSFSGEIGYIFASEWMQCDPYGWEKCAEHGSDNSIFITKVLY